MPARKCIRHSKRTKNPCRAHAMQGKDVCYHHGGKSLNGIASPRYRHGRYSKSIPAKLAQRYEVARTNPALLSVRDDLAVCESRLADLFQRVDQGESGALWKQLGATLAAFDTAVAKNDLIAMQGHLATMRTLITQGAGDYAAWAEIQALWETRCRLTAAEIKTLAAAQQFITVEQLMVYVGIITESINRIVPTHTDPASARAILGDLSAEFQKISVLEAGAEA